MGAYRAYLRRLGANHDVAAVAAFPHLDLALLEHFLHLHVFKQRPIALFMVLFNGSHGAELGGQGREPLFFRGNGEALVHIGPFIVFAVSCRRKILRCIADAVQFLKPHLGVLFFVIGCFQEQGGNLFETVLLGSGGEIGIFVTSLGFAGKGGFQVLFGLRSGIGILFRCFRLYLHKF